MPVNEPHVQLRNVLAERNTIHLGHEINWEEPDRITFDLDRIKRFLLSHSLMQVQVRITNGPIGGYKPLSEWSETFFVAYRAEDCPRQREPTSPPTSFPDSPVVRGEAGDLWADVILGQPDFSEITPNQVVPYKLFNPGGVTVDRARNPGLAYVWDSGNSRVLGIDLEKCYSDGSPCMADVVLGQPSGYDHSACNGDSGYQGFPVRSPAGPDTLCGLPPASATPLEHPSFVTMAIDERSNLFVPDVANHRVLEYRAPFDNDSKADEVWGQSDFTGVHCNRGLALPSAESLCFISATTIAGPGGNYGSGVALGPDGDLWVADSGNNRVLRFPVQSETGRISRTADVVLGQRSFETSDFGSELYEMHSPSSVRVGPKGILYVADAYNHRVLAFQPPFESGMSAMRTFGSGFKNPNGLEADPEGRGLWVNDSGNGMVELWDWSGLEVLAVALKEAYLPDGHRPYWISGGIGIDGESNLLVSEYAYGQDVLSFRISLLGEADRGVPDPNRRLFSPPRGFNLVGSDELISAYGVAVWGDQLVVADVNRLVYWNGLDRLESGRPPDGIIGLASHYFSWATCCYRIKVDELGRLWALNVTVGNAWLDVYQLPLHERSVPLHTVLAPMSSLQLLGTDQELDLGNRIFGIAPVGKGEFLWLSDSANHRVLRVRDPLTNPVVDVVLGQKDATGVKCNRRASVETHASGDASVYSSPTADVLCFPGSLSLDRQGNLYVSDHSLEIEGNRRLLVFPKELFPANANSVIYAPSASKSFLSHPGPDHNMTKEELIRNDLHHLAARDLLDASTFEVAFDSGNRMVAGFNLYGGGRFVGVFETPLGQGTAPNVYLYDLASMPYAIAFDAQSNLYVADINRGRVLVYWNPFDNSPLPTEPGLPEAPDLLTPQYAGTILSIHPAPPYCVVPEGRDYEALLTLVVDGVDIPRVSGDDESGHSLEFRVIGTHISRSTLIGHAKVETERGGDSKTTIEFIDRRFWRELLAGPDPVTVTVRVINTEGVPLTGWSPSFSLAPSIAACGVALPAPTPVPPPTPTPLFLRLRPHLFLRLRPHLFLRLRPHLFLRLRPHLFLRLLLPLFLRLLPHPSRLRRLLPGRRPLLLPLQLPHPSH